MVNLSQLYETLQSSRQIAGTTGSETSDTHTSVSMVVVVGVTNITSLDGLLNAETSVVVCFVNLC